MRSLAPSIDSVRNVGLLLPSGSSDGGAARGTQPSTKFASPHETGGSSSPARWSASWMCAPGSLASGTLVSSGPLAQKLRFGDVQLQSQGRLPTSPSQQEGVQSAP